MKVVLDTNVLVSGVFFRGPPLEILRAWRAGRIQLVVSPEILEEYREVGLRLSLDFPGVDISAVLAVVTTHATLMEPALLPERVCSDPDDDKFFACALKARAKVIVSGDKHLLAASGYKGIHVVRPRRFLDDWLR